MPALVERLDDLVGGADVLLALRVALRIGPVGLERAAPLHLGAVERVLRARQHLVDVAGVARRGDAADGHRHGDRPDRGLHHVVARADQQAVGRDQHVVGRAVVEDDAELVAGEAAEMVLAAQLRADARGDRGDHLVGDVEAVGLVDAAEIVDRGQHEAAGRAQLDRLVDGGFQHRRHVPAVHLAGERRRSATDRRAAAPARGARRSPARRRGRAPALPSGPANQRPVSSIQCSGAESGVGRSAYCTW